MGLCINSKQKADMPPGCAFPTQTVVNQAAENPRNLTGERGGGLRGVSVMQCGPYLVGSSGSRVFRGPEGAALAQYGRRRSQTKRPGNLETGMTRVAVRKVAALAAAVAALLVCLAGYFLAVPAFSVDDRLAVFIDCEIASHHQSPYSAENFCCLDWEVIGREGDGGRTTLYMWVLYKGYSCEDDLVLEAGAHMLTAITVEESGGGYRLVEYWEPEDGAHYGDSVKEKVPMLLWLKAMDSQRYIGEQSQALERMAREHFGLELADG